MDENTEENEKKFTIKPIKTYQVDWDKVNTIDDLKYLLKALRFTIFIDDNMPTDQFDELFEKGLLIEK